MTIEWNGCGNTNSNGETCVEVNADVIRYVNKVDTDSGWVLVQLAEGSGPLLSMYKYAKVMLLGTKSGRTYFRVMEGEHAGKIVRMRTANAETYLGKTAPKQSGVVATVTYTHYDPKWVSIARGNQVLEQQFATLEVEGVSAQVVMNSVWGVGYYPIPAGTYRILLPDAPHNKDMTAFYQETEPSLSHHQVWFPIEYGDNSRYIHVGNLSDGCTTVVDLAKWSAIHEALISHRAPDATSVGTLIVKGTPQRAN